jgi:hypothetical protein
MPAMPTGKVLRIRRRSRKRPAAVHGSSRGVKDGASRVSVTIDGKKAYDGTLTEDGQDVRGSEAPDPRRSLLGDHATASESMPASATPTVVLRSQSAE